MDQEEIYKGMHYNLTKEDRESITGYFNDDNLTELVEFCEALAMVASFFAWDKSKVYLKEVGFEGFFKECGNCGNMFDCAPRFALDECGNRYKKWIPKNL